MRNELQKLLASRYPTLKKYQVTDSVNSYIAAVMKEIAVQYANVTSEDIEAGEFSFAADLVNKSSGQVSIGKKRPRVYSVMQSDPCTSLVIVTYTGNSISKRVSKVTFNPKYKKDILNELITSTYALTPAYLDELDELDENSNYSITVDMEALESYIKNTRRLLATARDGKYKEKLTRNKLASERIMQKAELQEDGSYLVKEYWTQIDSGRVHGHGLSLQLVAKEVRHAALGRCAKIDFKASSYAILTSLALAINPRLKVEALKSYIKYRTSVRIRIAKVVGISVDWMKTIFTSLGFGAEVKDNKFNSIRKLLGQEKFNLLVGNQEFAYIKQELDLVRKTILTSDAFKCDGFVIGNNTYKELDSKTGKKRTKNQKMAWIFQACERMALDIIIDKMPDNFKILLPVHDCLYIKQQLPSQVVLDLKDHLLQLFPLLDFDQELIIPIHAEEDHDKHNAAIDQAEAEHKQRIALEELGARGHKSEFFDMDSEFCTETDYSNETDAEYELRRRQQFLLDVQQYEVAMEIENYGTSA